MSKLKTSNRGILLYRCGSDNAVAQKDNLKLPNRFKRGVWAFPFPYMDFFFTIHRMEKTKKKIHRWKLNDFGSQEHVDNPQYVYSDVEDSRKFKLFKRSLTTFWYDGPMLSRIGSNTNPNCYEIEDWYYWHNPRVWADYVTKYLPNSHNRYSVDHLELFCIMKG